MLKQVLVCWGIVYIPFNFREITNPRLKPVYRIDFESTNNFKFARELTIGSSVDSEFNLGGGGS